jgi:hypothetical protein
MGVEAFEAECAAKVEARAAQEAARAAGALSRKEQKNQSYWQRRNQRKKASRGCACEKSVSKCHIFWKFYGVYNMLL